MRPAVLLLAFTALAMGSGCVPVSGDRILASDMARAVPAFAAVQPELALGFAPAPGARRTYGTAELLRLAARYGLTVEPGIETCFARPLQMLTAQQIIGALESLMPAAHPEVLDFSHQPVPPGELQFARPVTGTGDAQLWHGVIRRAGQADFPVWARVRMRVSGTRTVAVETLSAGLPIAPGQLRAESYEGPPGFPDLAHVVGRAPKRSIPAGAVIEAGGLEIPADVLRGDTVRVEVRSGHTRLLLEGLAQSSGRRGQVIAVRNPANGKVFRATIEERGQVFLTTDPQIPREGQTELP